MATAKLRLFASARVAAGTGADSVEAETVGGALDVAVERYGSEFEQVLATCRIWCNGDEADRAHELRDGDEVAVLPPVSGGSGAD